MQRLSDDSGTVARWFVLAAVFVGLALVCRLPSFVDAPLDRDEGAYALIAQQWSRGAMPYRDYFDHKPPLVYLAYRAVFALAGEHLAAVRIVFAVLSGFTACACVLLVLLLQAQRRAWPAVLAGLAACVFLSAPLLQGETANTETLMLLGSVASACFALRAVRDGRLRDAVLAGACVGAAALAKPLALFEAAFFGGWLLLHERRRPRRQVGGFVAAMVAPALAWLIYAVVRGGALASIDAVALYNLRYAAVAPVPVWARVASLPIDYGWPLALLWVGVAGCTLDSLRRPPTAANFALGWTTAALIAVLSAGRLFFHYYQELVPPMAVALGVTASAAATRMRGYGHVVGGVAAVALGLLPPLASVVQPFLDNSRNACAAWQPRLAGVIEQMTAADDTVLVWGAEPFLYFAAKRRPLDRFIYIFPFEGKEAAATAARDELLTSWTQRPPAVVVVAKRGIDLRPATGEMAENKVPLFALLREFVLAFENDQCLVFVRDDHNVQAWRAQQAGIVPAACRNAGALQ